VTVPRRLLVIGFGPFWRMPRNPSAAVARRIAGSPRWRALGIAAPALVLPTTYAALDGELRAALVSGGFDALLMLGVAGRARSLRVERRAVNRSSLLFPDAAGQRPAALAAAGMPATRTARAATRRVLAILRRRGLAGTLSQDAGRYLCNAAYLRALAVPAPVLFVHIPRPPDPGRRGAARSRRLAWETQLAAGLADVALDLLRGARGRTAARAGSGQAPTAVGVLG